MNKKYLVFGIIGLFALALVSAATYYSYVTMTVNVNQPIEVTPSGVLLQQINCDSGHTCIGEKITVSNDDDKDRTISLRETGSGLDVEVNYVGKLVLEDKDSVTWDADTTNARTADFHYFITGEEMGYHMEAVGLEEDIEYTLIYYLDSGETDSVSGKPWNLNHAIEIASGTSDSAGNLLLEGNKEFNSDVPFSGDYNANPNVNDNYCNGDNGFDNYLHCSGAKIWLITGDLELSNWNPNDWLFETDLIHYFDNTDGEYTIKKDSSVEFYPLFTVDDYAPDQTRTITIFVE